jgi:hypothetical protein
MSTNASEDLIHLASSLQEKGQSFIGTSTERSFRKPAGRHQK